MNYPSDKKIHTCTASKHRIITEKECREKQDVKICSPDCNFYMMEKYSATDFGVSKLTEVGKYLHLVGICLFQTCTNALFVTYLTWKYLLLI